MHLLIIIWFQNYSRKINHLTSQKSTLESRNAKIVHIINSYFQTFFKTQSFASSFYLSRCFNFKNLENESISIGFVTLIIDKLFRFDNWFDINCPITLLQLEFFSSCFRNKESISMLNTLVTFLINHFKSSCIFVSWSG